MTKQHLERITLNVDIDREIVATKKTLTEHKEALTVSILLMAKDSTLGINTFSGHLADLGSISQGRKSKFVRYAKLVRKDSTFPYKCIGYASTLNMTTDDIYKVHKVLYPRNPRYAKSDVTDYLKHQDKEVTEDCIKLAKKWKSRAIKAEEEIKRLKAFIKENL